MRRGRSVEEQRTDMLEAQSEKWGLLLASCLCEQLPGCMMCLPFYTQLQCFL